MISSGVKLFKVKNQERDRSGLLVLPAPVLGVFGVSDIFLT